MLKRELDRGINSKLQQRVKSLEQKINNIKMSIQHIKTDNEHVSQSASGLRRTSTSSKVTNFFEQGSKSRKNRARFHDSCTIKKNRHKNSARFFGQN